MHTVNWVNGNTIEYTYSCGCVRRFVLNAAGKALAAGTGSQFCQYVGDRPVAQCFVNEFVTYKMAQEDFDEAMLEAVPVNEPLWTGDGI